MVRMLDAATLLSAWEAAESEPELQRPAVLLNAVWPDLSVEEWALRPIGDRDRYLIQFREAWFGTRFETVAKCPRCAERMDVAFWAADIAAPITGSERLSVSMGGREIAFRLPNSADLLEASQAGPENMRARLLDLCVVDADSLSDEIRATVVAAMAEADPQADVQVSVTCPACGQVSSHSFDVAAHLWDEISDWAARLFSEIHALASAYGWSEREILTMSALRRRTYLQLVEV